MRNTFAIILIVVAVAAGYFYTYPSLTETMTKWERSSTYSDALSTIDQFRQQREDLLTELDSLPDRQKDRLQMLMPTSTDPVRLATDLDEFARRNGISLSSISFPQEGQNASGARETGTPLGEYTATPIQISFSAQYPQMLSFMRRLEEQLRLFDVTRVSFSAADDGRHSYTMTLQTYSLQ